MSFPTITLLLFGGLSSLLLCLASMYLTVIMWLMYPLLGQDDSRKGESEAQLKGNLEEEKSTLTGAHSLPCYSCVSPVKPHCHLLWTGRLHFFFCKLPTPLTDLVFFCAGGVHLDPALGVKPVSQEFPSASTAASNPVAEEDRQPEGGAATNQADLGVGLKDGQSPAGLGAEASAWDPASGTLPPPPARPGVPAGVPAQAAGADALPPWQLPGVGEAATAGGAPRRMDAEYRDFMHDIASDLPGVQQRRCAAENFAKFSGSVRATILPQLK